MSFYSADKIRSGLREFLIGRIAAAILSFVANILIVRVMAEDAYAGYVTLAGLQLVLLVLFSFGIERVMARYAGEAALHWSRHNVTVLVGGGLLLRATTVLILALALVPFADSMAGWISIDGWQHVAPAFWLYTLFFGLFEILQVVAQSFMHQKAIRLGLTLQWSLRVAGVCYYVITKQPLGLNEILWIFAVTSLIPSLILLPSILNVIGSRPQQTSAKPFNGTLSRVLALGGHNYLEKLASLPSSGAFFRLLAANALPSVATASFGFYQTLWGVLHRHMPTTISMSMLEATSAGRYAERRDQAEIGVVLSVMFKVNLMFILPIIAWLVASGAEVVTLLTGGKYVEQAWALPLVASSLIPAGYWQLLIVFSNTLSVPSILSRSAAWSSLLVIPLVILVIQNPDSGLFLLALALPLIGLIQAGIAHWYLNAKSCRLRIDVRGVAYLVLAAILAGAAASHVALLAGNQHPLVGAGLSASAIASVFILVIYLSKVFTMSESALLSKLHHRLASSMAWACQKAES